MDWAALTADIPASTAWNFIFKLAALPVIIFLVLLVHELGHFFAARLFRIPVKDVAIGSGPVFFEREDSHSTRWKLGIIPFGAHVNLAGLAGGSNNAFETKPYWQRALTIFAGPLVNLILPFLLLTVFYLAVGQPSAPPVVTGIEKGLVADKAGLRPGDRILEINGVKVYNYRQVWREGYDKGPVEGVYKIRRGDKEFDLKLTPTWTKYIDDDGIQRSNARFGILWDHVPFKLSAIRSINGQDVEKKPGLARELFTKNFDRYVTVDIKGPDDKPYIYSVFPRAAMNPDLNNKDSEEYKKIFLGESRGNFYLRQPVAAQLYDAFAYGFDRIGKIVSLPRQVLPIDPYALNDPDSVHNDDSMILDHVYSFIHGMLVASIIIGLVNLLPLPYLDGGHIVTQGIEAATGRPMSRKAQALLFTTAFLGLYVLIFISNIDKLPRYIDSRLKKVHEFINQNHSDQ